MICENCGHDIGSQKVAVELPSPEYTRVMQEIVQRTLREVTLQLWRETPWRKKMRQRWRRLLRVWSPA